MPLGEHDASARLLADQIGRSAHRLTGNWADFDPLLEMIGDARYVLIGEASHGTQEFYQTRALITHRLIMEKGFTAVCAEADWPDACRINRYVRGRGDGATSLEALAAFTRFPAWMWRNTVVLDFVGWLRHYNENNKQTRREVGFYGLDLYSLYSSIEAVIHYLEQADPDAAYRARERYACFEDFGKDPQSYGLLSGYARRDSCEDQVVKQLVELQHH
ncbi:MAG TPA: erythromycin esterase family protein, partial [Ktedonobacterales bacterium]|nr:erythromycin esterase family protein [Ktedonobacterales bacterium]